MLIKLNKSKKTWNIHINKYSIKFNFKNINVLNTTKLNKEYLLLLKILNQFGLIN